MKSKLIIVFTIIFFGYSCMKDPSSEEESSPEDCAGVVGGENVCGCTDSTANNYNLEATYDDSSCLYDTLNTFNKTYGGSMGESGVVSLVDDEDNIFVFGYTESSGQGMRDIWLIKTDSNGNQIWEKTFGGLSQDGVSDAIFTDQNQMAITGWSLTDYVFSGDSLTYYGRRSLNVSLIDLNGNLIWEKIYGNGLGGDMGRNIIETTDGNFVVTGSTKIDSNSIVNGYVMMVNNQGEKIWEFTKNDSNYTNFSEFRSVFEIDNQLLIMTTRYNDGPSNGGTMIKLALDGSFISETLLNDPQHYQIFPERSIMSSNEMNIISVGYGKIDNESDAFGYVNAIDLNCNIEWTFYIDPRSEFKSVLQRDDKFILVGYEVDLSTGISNGLLIIVDINGNLIDEINYEGEGWDVLNDVSILNQNEIIITGYNSSAEGNGQLWIVRQECCD